MLKFDYLKNEKSFRSEIKAFFLVSNFLSFRDTKQTSKNVADTTFNSCLQMASCLTNETKQALQPEKANVYTAKDFRDFGFWSSTLNAT